MQCSIYFAGKDTTVTWDCRDEYWNGTINDKQYDTTFQYSTGPSSFNYMNNMTSHSLVMYKPFNAGDKDKFDINMIPNTTQPFLWEYGKFTDGVYVKSIGGSGEFDFTYIASEDVAN